MPRVTEEQRRKIEEKIIRILKDAHPDDLPEVEIAKRVGVHWLTIRQYLRKLVKEKKLKFRMIGKYKLYRPR